MGQSSTWLHLFEVLKYSQKGEILDLPKNQTWKNPFLILRITVPPEELVLITCISFFMTDLCKCKRGWSGDAMVLGKLPVPGCPTVWIRVGQGPTALAVGAGGCCLDIFSLVYHFSPLSPSL